MEPKRIKKRTFMDVLQFSSFDALSAGCCCSGHGHRSSCGGQGDRGRGKPDAGACFRLEHGNRCLNGLLTNISPSSHNKSMTGPKLDPSSTQVLSLGMGLTFSKPPKASAPGPVHARAPRPKDLTTGASATGTEVTLELWRSICGSSKVLFKWQCFSLQ